MELFFLLVLIVLMATALGSGFPVAYALPGSAILTITLAGVSGYLFAGDASAYFAQGNPYQWLTAGITNFRGVYWDANRDTLIAVPLFIFMGIMLERSKIAEDLLVTMAQLFGPIPGGLGISVVAVGALLAATTGIVGATVVAMGLISLPVMLRNNYSKMLGTGTIAASGTLGQIIPPSIVLIILADQLSSATDQALTLRKADFKAATGQSFLPPEYGLTSTSAGDMFLGAFAPGLVLVGMYIVYILILSLIRPRSAPPVPYEGRYDLQFLVRVLVVLVPPLALIFLVLGSILLGIATVNQAGAIGAIGAMVMAGYRLMQGKRHAYTPAILAVASVVAILVLINVHEINVKNIRGSQDVLFIALAVAAVAVLTIAMIWSGWRIYKIDKTLEYVMVETAKTCALVFIILIGAAMLTAAFRSFGGEDLVREFLTGLPGGFLAKFVLVMAVIFVLGFFLDFIEIAVVVVPIISPILLADPSANVTAVWLGVMIGVNMQTSFLTPPFGFALFYLRGVAPPEVTTLQIYRGVAPFILLQLGGLAVVGAFPPLVNYLPNRVYLTSETAPPPINPRLQACLENWVFAAYDDHGDEMRAAIDKMAAQDVSYLPKKWRTSLAESYTAARATFGHVDKVRAAEAAVAAYVPEYEPIHNEVRDVHRQIALVDKDLAELQQTADRLSHAETPDVPAQQDVERKIDALNKQKSELEAQIPANWPDSHKHYLELADAEKKARNAYRRNVDNAYEPINQLRKIIAKTDDLAAVRKDLEALGPIVASQPAEQVSDAIKSVQQKLRRIPETSAINSPLTKARRLFRKDDPNRDDAAKFVAQSIKKLEPEAEWRAQAAERLGPALNAYNAEISDTIGLRQQERLTSDQATDVAGCLSYHRDISLDF
jgi:tripartite ATP-independent transporter DctM subunit